MRIEISSAAQFLVDLVRLNNTSPLSDDQLERFRNNVSELLQRHYTNHWFPDKPFKGSGYRCIRINGKMDPLIARAGFMMGLAVSFLRSLFPTELTMWVDPREVSYRIGENGSICILYEGVEKPIITNTTKKTEDLPLTAPTEPKTPEKPLQAPPPPQQTPSPPPALPQHHQPPPPPPPQHQQQVHHHHHHQHHHQQQQHFSPSKSVVISSPLQHSPPMSPVTSQQHHHHQHHQHHTAMQLSMFLMNKESGLIKCKESLPRGLEARSLQMDRLFVSS